MIPIETRKKIFALYWGQKIMRSLDYEPNWKSEKVNPDMIKDWDLNYYFIEVTPVSQITDEIARGLAIRLNFSSDFVQNGKATYNRLPLNFNPLNISAAIDYLRENSVAVNAYGYTVEELIQEGIFKLKTETT